jgi:dienelactone hydrolase
LEEPILRDENYWPGWLDRAPYFKGYAVDDLELSEDVRQFPIILLSHGSEGIRGDLFEKGEVLASHGYVVVAPDHSDATAVVLPNGSYEFRNKGVQLTGAGLRDRVRDFSFLVDQLEQWSVCDPRFAGRLELGKIAAMGFSWGGATALEFCRADTRCRIAVALDPGGSTTPELLQDGLQKPSLTINRSDNGDCSLYDQAAADAVWFQISNTTHGDIGGWAWWPNGTIAAVQNAAEINRSANSFTVWFLNRHLRGSNEVMPVLTDYPRIINFRQK